MRTGLSHPLPEELSRTLAGGGPGSRRDAASRAEQVQVILEHIDQLPTLSPVAVRVLALASEPDVDLHEIARIIEADPSLSARVLRLCLAADRASARNITTVDRAIVQVGLDAVRAAMLSVEVYELVTAEDAVRGSRSPELDDLERAAADDAHGPGRPFERQAFWRHLLATACAAELIAEGHQDTDLAQRLDPREAFLCGLLHDLGKLALDRVLPRSFQRCVELCAQHRADIAEVERAVIGLDHHVAGKRLAEQWGLPHALQDVIWLHNQPAGAIPDVEHRHLVACVTVAQCVARTLHLGWSGATPPTMSPEELAAGFGLDPDVCGGLDTQVFERLATRAAQLGLDDDAGADMLMGAIAEANRQLGRLNSALQRRAQEAEAHRRLLEAIDGFQAAPLMRPSLAATMADVARSAGGYFNARRVAFVWQPRGGAVWQLHTCGAEGLDLRGRQIGTPPGGEDLRTLADVSGLGPSSAPLLGWLGERLREPAAGEGRGGEGSDAGDGAAGAAERDGASAGLAAIASMRMVPLLLEAGPAAILLHDGEPDPRTSGHPMEGALIRSWASALAASAQHDGARRLGEQLAQANRSLAATQDALVEARSMARLGELAAGAAHEMNNPLTVISGNAQVLSARLLDADNRGRAAAMVGATQRLSDLITSLHLFADPPEPKPTRSDLRTLLEESAASARSRFASARAERQQSGGPVLAQAGSVPEISIEVDRGLDRAFIDRRQVGSAVTELLVNALEAEPRGAVRARAFVSSPDGRLLITVTDDGKGMSGRALRHACDPFFSEKEAGRQPGLGLARARRLVDLHGGELTLASELGSGTTATIALSDWRGPRVRRAA